MVTFFIKYLILNKKQSLFRIIAIMLNTFNLTRKNTLSKLIGMIVPV